MSGCIETVAGGKKCGGAIKDRDLCATHLRVLVREERRRAELAAQREARAQEAQEAQAQEAQAQEAQAQEAQAQEAQAQEAQAQEAQAQVGRVQDQAQAAQLLAQAHEEGLCLQGCLLCEAEESLAERQVLVAQAAQLREERDEARRVEQAALDLLAQDKGRADGEDGADQAIAEWMAHWVRVAGDAVSHCYAPDDHLIACVDLRISLGSRLLSDPDLPDRARQTITEIRATGCVPFMVSAHTSAAPPGRRAGAAALAAPREFAGAKRSIFGAKIRGELANNVAWARSHRRAILGTAPPPLQAARSFRERAAVRAGWRLLCAQRPAPPRDVALIVEPQGKGPIDARFVCSEELARVLTARGMRPAQIKEALGQLSQDKEQLNVVMLFRDRAAVVQAVLEAAQVEAQPPAF